MFSHERTPMSAETCTCISCSLHRICLSLICGCRSRTAHDPTTPNCPSNYFAGLKALCAAVDQHVFLAMRPLCSPGMTAASCNIDYRNRICVYLVVGASIGYFMVICYLCFWKLKQHKRFPIRVVQVGMLYFRLQVSS